MKKLFFLISLLIVTISTFAQVPAQFSYQAVLRNNDGSVISNAEVEVAIDILAGSTTGTSVFTETHTATTDSQGLVSLRVGSEENLGEVDWSSGPFFLKVSVNGVVVGTTQLLSVPFALYSLEAESFEEVDPTFSSWDKSSGITVTESQISDLQGYLTAESDPAVQENFDFTGAAAGDLLQYDGTKWVKVTPGYLSSYTETDPEFTAWDRSTGVEITESQVSDLQNYLTEESDPALASNFDFAGAATGDLLQYNGMKWVKFSPNYITSYTETDPVFSAWNRTTGISITESQISDMKAYLTSESDPNVSSNFDFTEAATGDLLRFNGTKWERFTPDYLTSYAESQTLSDVLSLGNDAGAQRISNIALPEESGDAATKVYVDSLEQRVNALMAWYETVETKPLVSSAIPSAIKSYNAVCGGIVHSEGGSAVTARGIVWNTTGTPTVGDNLGSTSNGTGEGEFESELSGLSLQTTYYVRAYATNTDGTSYGNQVEVETLPLFTLSLSVDPIDGGTVTGDGDYEVGTEVILTAIENEGYMFYSWTINNEEVSFSSDINYIMPAMDIDIVANFTSDLDVSDIDGNIYETTVIGEQRWMAENLKTTKYNDGTDIPLVTNNETWINLVTPAYCWYNNDKENFGNEYGALYNWHTVNSLVNGGKNICPVGWHLPSNDEWSILVDFISENGFEGIEGTALKSTTGWFTGNGTDDFGFSAKPAGNRNDNSGNFDNLSYHGHWWTSTEYSYDNAYYRGMSFIEYDLYSEDPVVSFPVPKSQGFSIRCIKD